MFDIFNSPFGFSQATRTQASTLVKGQPRLPVYGARADFKRALYNTERVVEQIRSRFRHGNCGSAEKWCSIQRFLGTSRKAMAISIKTPDEIERMRVAGRLAAEVLDMIEPYVEAGIPS